MDTQSLIILIVALSAIVILVFLLLREVACWYWKINERINLQSKQLAILEKLAEKLDVDMTSLDKK